MSGETFGWAIKQLHDGRYVERRGWNGRGMFLFFVRAVDWQHYVDLKVSPPMTLMPFIAMKTADNMIVPWLASQTDVLATDWKIAAP